MFEEGEGEEEEEEECERDQKVSLLEDAQVLEIREARKKEEEGEEMGEVSVGEGVCVWEKLPKDLVFIIANYLSSLHDRGQLSLVNKRTQREEFPTHHFDYLKNLTSFSVKKVISMDER